MNFRYTILYVEDVRASLDFFHRAFGFDIAFLEHLEDMTHLLGLLNSEKRRFSAMPRADEAIRPTEDQRARKARAAQDRAATEDAARLMPKGRNFH